MREKKKDEKKQNSCMLVRLLQHANSSEDSNSNSVMLFYFVCLLYCSSVCFLKWKLNLMNNQSFVKHMHVCILRERGRASGVRIAGKRWPE